MAEAAGVEELGGAMQQGARTIARNWRKLVALELVKEGKSPQLGGLVEPFIEAIGSTLAQGESPECAWASTQGVLRLSGSRGMLGLFDEFAGLRRVLRDWLCTQGASPQVKRHIDAMLDSAVDSAMSELKSTVLPPPSPFRMPFGGSVVVMFEPRPAELRQPRYGAAESESEGAAAQ